MQEFNSIEMTVKAATITADEVEKNVQARLRSGRALVIAGFILSILGIVFYCVDSFAAIGQPDAPLISGNLSVLGAGVLMWVVGAVKYLNAAIDSNIPDDQI